MDLPNSSREEIAEYLEKGAVVIDVRNEHEYDEGHVEGSELIVLPTIPGKVSHIKSYEKPVIAVCRTGNRSGQAGGFLKNQGIDIINGGAWQEVAAVIEER